MKRFVWFILFGAIVVRLFLLTDIPPGLTHDEADHGISAWRVVEGERPLYFTIGYGREPLYDYLTAGIMAGVGKTFLAGRLLSAWLGLLLLPLMFVWVKRVWGWQTAVLTIFFLAFNFWPVMSSRQMLRSVALPTLFASAVVVWWQLLYPKKITNRKERRRREDGFAINGKIRVIRAIRVNSFSNQGWIILLAGVLLGLTFYTYIPARALWLAFPLTILYSWLTPNDKLRWQETALVLLVAGLVGLPLFWHLHVTPTAEVRIGQLSAPLTQAMGGDFALLWQNVQAGVGAIFMQGDSAWRYNIAERPFLSLPLSTFFLFGLASALLHLFKRGQQTATASFFLLTWFAIGLAPVLITGPELSMTQGIGMQPTLYLFVALGIHLFYSSVSQQPSVRQNAILIGFVLLLMAGELYVYFEVWGNHPEVRVQYETTMTEAMHHINQNDFGTMTVSTITPHPYHTPALAEMVLWEDEEIAWVDGRSALLWHPTSKNTLIQSGFSPLNETILARLQHTIIDETIDPLRSDDLDRPLTISQFDGEQLLQIFQEEMTPQNATFGDALTLIGTMPIQFKEGATGTKMLTLWEIQQPLPHAVLFTHMIPDGGELIAQADQLSTDSHLWQQGDMLLQVHLLSSLAFEPLYVGVYTCPDADCTQGTTRLPINNDPAHTALRIDR